MPCVRCEACFTVSERRLVMSNLYFWLTVARFSNIRPHLPGDTRGVAPVDERRVISGIIHVLRSGCRWRHAPRDQYSPRPAPSDDDRPCMVDGADQLRAQNFKASRAIGCFDGGSETLFCQNLFQNNRIRKYTGGEEK